VNSGVFIKPRLYPIEMSAMGSTRSRDKQQDGDSTSTQVTAKLLYSGCETTISGLREPATTPAP
jgi:hypothetical protein